MVRFETGSSQTLSGIQYGIAGAFSGVFSRFLLQPLDVLKIRFQLQTASNKLKENKKYTSIFQSVRLIVKEEGITGLWKGHIPAQYLSFIFGAVQFSTYEIVTSHLTENNPYKVSGIEHLISISAGSIAGLSATVVSFPFDVVKTHLVFQSNTKVYDGMLDAIRKIYRKNGVRGFSKGMAAACIQTAPSSGLVFCFHGLFNKAWFLLVPKHDFGKNSVFSTSRSMITGLLAGLCAKTVVYPFDLMKKRLQIQNFEEKNSNAIRIVKYKGIFHCFITTVKNEGYFGLFKGLYPSLLKAGATTSIYFTIYGKICQILQCTSR